MSWFWWACCAYSARQQAIHARTSHLHRLAEQALVLARFARRVLRGRLAIEAAAGSVRVLRRRLVPLRAALDPKRLAIVLAAVRLLATAVRLTALTTASILVALALAAEGLTALASILLLLTALLPLLRLLVLRIGLRGQHRRAVCTHLLGEAKKVVHVVRGLLSSQRLPCRTTWPAATVTLLASAPTAQRPTMVVTPCASRAGRAARRSTAADAVGTVLDVGVVKPRAERITSTHFRGFSRAETERVHALSTSVQAVAVMVARPRFRSLESTHSLQTKRRDDAETGGPGRRVRTERAFDDCCLSCSRCARCWTGRNVSLFVCSCFTS